MGNRVMVKPHSESAEMVSIRPVRKNARPHFMGTVILSNVTVHADGFMGDMLEEFTEARELGAKALTHVKRVIHTDRGFVLSPAWDAYVTALDSWIESDDDNATEPDFPQTVNGKTFKAAYVCGSDFYVG